MAFAQRREAFGEFSKGVHLVRSHAAERQLDTDHLHTGLALTVDALLQAEADELTLVKSPFMKR